MGRERDGNYSSRAQVSTGNTAPEKHVRGKSIHSNFVTNKSKGKGNLN